MMVTGQPNATPARKTFLPLVGQYDNLGDVYLRRALAQELDKPRIELHILVDRGQDGFLTALNLPRSAKVHRRRVAWYFALLRAVLADRQAPNYVFKPGEILLEPQGLLEPALILPILVMVRIRGGRIARVGVGVRGAHPLVILLTRLAARLSHFNFWRTAEAQRLIGRGEVMPDLAFLEQPSLADHSRDILAVSFRSDRSPLPSEWLNALDAYSKGKGLRIVPVAQVKRDNPVVERLCKLLPTACELRWATTSYTRHEEALHGCYSRARLVVSDRLHVLIAAALRGAACVALVSDETKKLEEHFDAARVRIPFVAISAYQPQDLGGLLDEAISMNPQTSEDIVRARQRVGCILFAVRAEL